MEDDNQSLVDGESHRTRPSSDVESKATSKSIVNIDNSVKEMVNNENGCNQISKVYSNPEEENPPQNHLDTAFMIVDDLSVNTTTTVIKTGPKSIAPS